MTEKNKKIIVALDVPGEAAAEELLKKMGRVKPYVKVGMQLFYASGPGYVRTLKERGYPVFLDLKLHDIPQTVNRAAEALARLEIDMMTVHIAGGLRMLQAAVEGVVRVQNDRVTKIVGITQLTSTDQHVLNEQIGISGTVNRCVVRYAKLAREAEIDGVVCSGWEVSDIKAHCGRDFLAVTPGIRLPGGARGDQRRVMTPTEAVRCGADYLVIGRPIVQAEDPLAVYERILDMVKGW